ncbi:DUF3967 domain-containing protein [Bacillus testis]|uniref:DUF3967 domain-containing protein n=1 Tax=Bacillus testis TaxID=1622072 RepID=UPI00067F346E|nr:DUF3967 domain-containing protein [Bacillus testis]
MRRTEKPLTPKEASINLGIGDSTLRKWCIALESHKYFFPRTDNNRRVFFEKDMVVLRHLRELVQVQNFSLENASLVIVSKYKENASEQQNTDNSVPALRDPNEMLQGLFDHIEQQDKFNKELLERLDQQERFNKKLLEQLEEQDKYIKERMNKRDAMLMESLKASQETKKLLLEAQEEQKKKRKGLFSIFNKG